MAGLKQTLLSIVLPKGKTRPEGVSATTTYNSSSPNQVLTAPTYREHMTDLFATRSNSDSKTLISDLLRTDPDMSAALNAFLTVADTELMVTVRNPDGTLDSAGQAQFNAMLVGMTVRSDYSTGFQVPVTLDSIIEGARYMILARGGVAGELLMTKAFFPNTIRLMDLGTIEWIEPQVGNYKPQQKTNDGRTISLDIPSFYVSWFRKDPTAIYSHSPFISAINTIAARQQVINDLYRIMQVTGYPRMEATVVEEVILKTAPQEVKSDPVKKNAYIQQIIGNITSRLSSMRPDQAFVHTDSIEMGMMNEKTAGMELNIEPILKTLNAQNQAGLKSMATILGRGESGVNTASVEARVFSLSAQAINKPVAGFLSYHFTLAMRLLGYQGYVECKFADVEMRSALELATNMLVESQMLKDDLSLGIITDEEYHQRVYNRPPPEGAPVLSGTNFNTAQAGVDTTAISPNGDPVGKAATPQGSTGGARDNKSKPKSASKPSK